VNTGLQRRTSKENPTIGMFSYGMASVSMSVYMTLYKYLG